MAKVQDFPIKGFGSKLMISGKSINNLPDQFLSYSRNARIYDGGIWPRKGKQLLTNSVLWTNNKGGFMMNGKLFQIANSKIYEIDMTTGAQTEKATLGYDEITDILVYGKSIAIISSVWKDLKLYDWVTTVTTISTDPASFPSANSGILEYCRWFSFCTWDNILYISRPITSTNPEYSYDFTGSGSQSITFDSNIKWLKATMNGLYIFTENQVHHLDANSLQNVAGSATFISIPLWNSTAPINNLCIAGSWEKIFYISKSLQVMTINYLQYSTDSVIWELSARPVIGIKEFLNTISTSQPNAFAFYNENDKTIQFHIKSLESGYNDYVLVYDIVNDTWNVDTQKNYNYVVKNWYDYYGFSDVNSSVYIDDTGYSDAGSAIEFRIRTNNLIQGTILQKKYRWFYCAWGIGNQTDLNFLVNVDNENIFQETVSGAGLIPDVWEIGGSAIWDDPIGGDLTYLQKLNPFDRVTNEGRIFQDWKRIQVEIYSISQIQDFILDRIWVIAEYTWFYDINDAF